MVRWREWVSTADLDAGEGLMMATGIPASFLQLRERERERGR
jgi:hypothetical protein